MYVCLAVCLSVFLCHCRSLVLFLCLSTCMYACLSLCLSFFLCHCRSLGLFLCLCVYLHVCLSRSLSGCLPACMPVSLSVWLSWKETVTTFVRHLHEIHMTHTDKLYRLFHCVSWTTTASLSAPCFHNGQRVERQTLHPVLSVPVQMLSFSVNYCRF